jgi:RNA polymerase sigma-70 factor (ECF subfamily)
MGAAPESDITASLRAWTGGDRSALDQLMPVLYEELLRIAQSYMRRERTGHSLQTNALVHEAYTRLVEIQHVQWKDRAHFFAVAAGLMRRILVDHARSRGYLKRGGKMRRVPLEECAVVEPTRDAELLDLDEALTALEKHDARKARIVELRFFGGLTVDETAAVLGVSPQTVLRDWKISRVWLTRQMTRHNLTI